MTNGDRICSMNDRERCALLGDKQAQEECTPADGMESFTR